MYGYTQYAAPAGYAAPPPAYDPAKYDLARAGYAPLQTYFGGAAVGQDAVPQENALDRAGRWLREPIAEGWPQRQTAALVLLGGGLLWWGWQKGWFRKRR